MIDKEAFVVHAVARSGHHSFLSWFASGFGSRRVLYRNNLKPSRNPSSKAAKVKGRSFLEGVPTIEKVSDCDVIIESSEVWPVDARRFNEVKLRQHIIFLRDPFNTLASYLVGFRKSGKPLIKKPPEFARDRWVELASMVVSGKVPEHSFFLTFDDWRNQPIVRDALRYRFRIDPDDSKIRKVVSCIGGGSSFDRLQFKGRADQMDVDNRWRIAQEDPQYRSLLSSEILDLSQAIFPRLTEVVRSEMCV